MQFTPNKNLAKNLAKLRGLDDGHGGLKLQRMLEAICGGGIGEFSEMEIDPPPVQTRLAALPSQAPLFRDQKRSLLTQEEWDRADALLSARAGVQRRRGAPVGGLIGLPYPAHPSDLTPDAGITAIPVPHPLTLPKAAAGARTTQQIIFALTREVANLRNSLAVLMEEKARAGQRVVWNGEYIEREDVADIEKHLSERPQRPRCILSVEDPEQALDLIGSLVSKLTVEELAETSRQLWHNETTGDKRTLMHDGPLVDSIPDALIMGAKTYAALEYLVAELLEGARGMVSKMSSSRRTFASMRDTDAAAAFVTHSMLALLSLRDLIAVVNESDSPRQGLTGFHRTAGDAEFRMRVAPLCVAMGEDSPIPVSAPTLSSALLSVRNLGNQTDGRTPSARQFHASVLKRLLFPILATRVGVPPAAVATPIAYSGEPWAGADYVALLFSPHDPKTWCMYLDLGGAAWNVSRVIPQLRNILQTELAAYTTIRDVGPITVHGTPRAGVTVRLRDAHENYNTAKSDTDTRLDMDTQPSTTNPIPEDVPIVVAARRTVQSIPEHMRKQLPADVLTPTPAAVAPPQAPPAPPAPPVGGISQRLFAEAARIGSANAAQYASREDAQTGIKQAADAPPAPAPAPAPAPQIAPVVQQVVAAPKMPEVPVAVPAPVAAPAPESNSTPQPVAETPIHSGPQWDFQGQPQIFDMVQMAVAVVNRQMQSQDPNIDHLHRDLSLNGFAAKEAHMVPIRFRITGGAAPDEVLVTFVPAVVYATICATFLRGDYVNPQAFCLTDHQLLVVINTCGYLHTSQIGIQNPPARVEWWLPAGDGAYWPVFGVGDSQFEAIATIVQSGPCARVLDTPQYVAMRQERIKQTSSQQPTAPAPAPASEPQATAPARVQPQEPPQAPQPRRGSNVIDGLI